MTVQTNTTIATGIGNGVTSVFPITFKFNRAEDLIVYLVDSETEAETPLTLHSDYTIDGAGSENGGTLTLLAGPLPIGQSVVAQRIVDLRQLTDLRNQGRFFAEVHEDVFDKLVMIDQQQQTQLDRSMVIDLLWRWNALNRRIINVGDPVADKDATHKRYVDQGDSDSRQYADDRDAHWVARSLRTPDPVSPLPGPESRAGRLLSFDTNGRPVVVAPQPQSATELALQLADPDKGAAMVARGVVAVDSIADLLAFPSEARREDLRYLIPLYRGGEIVGVSAFAWAAASEREADDVFVYQAPGEITGRFIRLYANAALSEFAEGGAGEREQKVLDAAFGLGGIIVNSGVKNETLTQAISIPGGCGLTGDGCPNTFGLDTRGTVFGLDSSIPVAITLGLSEDGAGDRNRGIWVERIKVVGRGEKEGIGFSTFHSDSYSGGDIQARSVNNSLMVKNVAQNLEAGFRYHNCWNMDVRQNTAIGCGTGHLFDGSVGGTSSDFNGLLSYSCDIGFDFQAVGWTYASFNNCGSDGSDIALRLQGPSYRGVTIRNFGIENIRPLAPGGGIGVLIDTSTDSGVIDIDGLSFGRHDSENITFVKYVSGIRARIQNFDVTTAVLGACKLLEMGEDAGQLIFENGRVVAVGSDLGDIYDVRVTLKQFTVGARTFGYAIGGTDYLLPQSAVYNPIQASEANKQIFSKLFLVSASLDGANRTYGGTPAFRTETLRDWESVRFVNANLTGGIANFLSEEHTPGTGIVRDPSLSPETTIVLPNPGNYVVFEKRPDGKLYQTAIG